MASSPLDRIKIASPCGEDWDAMKGDDRQRRCAQCDQDVFDLSAMTRAEAEDLLRSQAGGRLCARLYRRADGRVLTADCPVGAATGQRRSFLAAGLAGAASLLLGGGAGLLATPVGRRLPILGGPAPWDHAVMGAMEIAPEPEAAPEPPRARMGQVIAPDAD